MKQKPFDSTILKRALKEAKCERMNSDFRYYKLGAAIFTNKKILTVGCNTNRSIPMQKQYNEYRTYRVNTCACHAEMRALNRLIKTFSDIRPQDVSILVYRETASGTPALARPCAACEKALRDYGITNIYYSGNNSFIYEKYNKKI